MSITVMSLVFAHNMPNLKTDDGTTVPDSTAKFVLLALADHCNDDGEAAYPSITKICNKTSMSRGTVCNAVNALRTNGYTNLEGASHKGTSNYTLNIALLNTSSTTEPVQPPNLQKSSHRTLTSSTTEHEPSINHPLTILTDENSKNQEPRTDAIKKGDMMDAILASEANNPAHKYAAIREEFERELDFNVLPWDGKNRAWGRLERFLFAAKQKDPDTIHRFATQRKEEGKFSKLPSNPKIYLDPDLLIAVWPPDKRSAKSKREMELEAAGYYNREET